MDFVFADTQVGFGDIVIALGPIVVVCFDFQVLQPVRDFVGFVFARCDPVASQIPRVDPQDAFSHAVKTGEERRRRVKRGVEGEGCTKEAYAYRLLS